MPPENSLRRNILSGARDGLPIGLGYFAVSFSLGIVAKSAGFSPVQGFLASFFNHASAGEYALYTLVAQNASYWEVLVLIFIANVRYLLMSAALSQRFSPDTSILHRTLVGFGITDELFGLGIAYPGWVAPSYMYSAFAVAELLWCSGTSCGIVAGNILPASAVSALSVAIYGMFLAIIVPPARKNHIVGALVLLSFVCSFVFSVLPLVSGLSDGIRTIILTVAISAFGAVLFPVPDEKGGEGA